MTKPEVLVFSTHEQQAYSYLLEQFSSLKLDSLLPEPYDHSIGDEFVRNFIQHLYLFGVTTARKAQNLSHYEVSPAFLRTAEDGTPDFSEQEQIVYAAILKSVKLTTLNDSQAHQVRGFIKEGNREELSAAYPKLGFFIMLIDILHDSRFEYLQIYSALLNLFEQYLVLGVDQTVKDIARTAAHEQRLKEEGYLS